MIVVAFALPEESREFRDALAGSPLAEKVRLVHLGAGSAAARRGAELAVREKPALLIATGFAGGLHPGLETGQIVVGVNVSAPAAVSTARQLGGASFGPLVTVERPVESAAQKIALGVQHSGLAVDMETAAVADVCGAADVPLLAVRVISDPAGEPLPVPFEEWFDLAGQRPRVARLLFFLARHPGRIWPFVRFVRGLAPARRTLADFLLRYLTAFGESPTTNGAPAPPVAAATNGAHLPASPKRRVD